MNITSVLKMIVTVFFLATLPELLYALTPSQIFDKVKDSIVVVKTMEAQGKMKMQGSGVLISIGRVATNCHVVDGGASYQVGRGKQFVPATIYAEDSDKDICLLDAKGITGKPAQRGKAANLKVGDPVYAVGAPQGLELSLSDGIVAQLRGGPPPLIQTTAAISRGSSGGGLFDGEGRLVGLTTLYLEAGQSLNFAMPVEWIVEVKPGQKVEWIAAVKPGRKSVAEGNTQTEWLKHANDLEQKKDWRNMIDWCRKWTKSEPNNAVAWVNLGWSYFKLKSDENAAKSEALREAMLIDLIKNFDAWSNFVKTERDLEQYNDAIEAYRQAIRIDPGCTIAWFQLGFVYRYLEHFDDAIEAFGQLTRIDPASAVNWYKLGNSYMGDSRYNNAIEAYRQAIRIDPEYAIAWHDLGWSYFKLALYEDAAESFRQALRIDPKNVAAWYMLGESYGNFNRYNDAIKALRQALSIDPKYVDAWYMLGIVYNLSGNRKAALDTVQELRRLDSFKADILSSLIVPR